MFPALSPRPSICFPPNLFPPLSRLQGVADSGADAQHGVAQPLSRKRSRPLAAEQLLPQLAAAVAAGEPQQKRLKEV